MVPGWCNSTVRITREICHFISDHPKDFKLIKKSYSLAAFTWMRSSSRNLHLALGPGLDLANGLTASTDDTTDAITRNQELQPLSARDIGHSLKGIGFLHEVAQRKRSRFTSSILGFESQHCRNFCTKNVWAKCSEAAWTVNGTRTRPFLKKISA